MPSLQSAPARCDLWGRLLTAVRGTWLRSIFSCRAKAPQPETFARRFRRIPSLLRSSQRLAGECNGHAWVALLADVRRRGLAADTYPAWSIDGPIALADLIDDPRDRRSATPVGSDGWLAMLATGGVEDFDRLLAGTDSR